MRVMELTGEALEREIEELRTCPATRENVQCYAAMLTIRHRNRKDEEKRERENPRKIPEEK